MESKEMTNHFYVINTLAEAKQLRAGIIILLELLKGRILSIEDIDRSTFDRDGLELALNGLNNFIRENE